MSELLHQMYTTIISHPYWLGMFAFSILAALTAAWILIKRAWLSDSGHSDYSHWS